MIASFTNNFIFIKTRKTGGTSVEIVLSAWCSGLDICSPINASDEAIRTAMNGHRPTRYIGARKCGPHMPAFEIQRALPDLWTKAFRFTVERHPYEKVISRAYWNIGQRGGDAKREFQAELDKVIAQATYLNYPLYTINGKLAVDEVIIYESLWFRMGELAQRFGRHLPDSIPYAKGQYRKDRRPAHEILTNRQKMTIREAAKFEFEMFGFDV